jgi:hypothetical protein
MTIGMKPVYVKTPLLAAILNILNNAAVIVNISNMSSIIFFLESTSYTSTDGAY